MQLFLLLVFAVTLLAISGYASSGNQGHAANWGPRQYETTDHKADSLYNAEHPAGISQ
jgi:hypothetical protein